jgi:hypothetical protein
MSPEKYDFRYTPEEENIETEVLANLFYGAGDVAGKTTHDVVSWGNKSAPLTFVGCWNFMANEESIAIPTGGVFGIGNNYYGDGRYAPIEHSFMHQLLKSKQITHNLFSFKYDRENDKKATLYLGEYHEDFSGEYAKCKMGMNKNKANNSHFGCVLSKVVIKAKIDGNEHSVSLDDSEIETDAIVDTGAPAIYGPTKSVEKIINIIHNKFKLEDTCELFEKILLVCKKKVLDSLLDFEFEFVFGDYGLKFKAKDVFACGKEGEDTCVFTIVANSADKWVIGYPLLKNYHVLHDIGKQELGFHGDYIDYSEKNHVKSKSGEKRRWRRSRFN